MYMWTPLDCYKSGENVFYTPDIENGSTRRSNFTVKTGLVYACVLRGWRSPIAAPPIEAVGSLELQQQ